MLIVSENIGFSGVVVFASILLLPMLALAMMDYQVRRANDITGSLIGIGESSEGILAGAVLLGIIVAMLTAFVVFKIKDARLVASMPHSRMSEEIKKIDEHLKR